MEEEEASVEDDVDNLALSNAGLGSTNTLLIRVSRSTAITVPRGGGFSEQGLTRGCLGDI